MSFLAQILTKASQSDIEHAEKDLKIISTKVTKYKTDILDYLKNVYVKYCEWPQQNYELLNKVNTLSDDIESLGDKIESITLAELPTNQTLIETFKLELKQSEIATSCLVSLMQIHEKLLKLKEYKSGENYVKAITELTDLEKLIETLPEADLLDVMSSIKSNLVLEKCFLVQTINEIFEDMIIVKEGKMGLMQINTIKIRKNDQEIQDIINAFALISELTPSLHKLKTFMWLCVCKPILGYVTQIRIQEDEKFYNLSVIIKRTTSKKNYKDSLDNLLQVFTFISKHLSQEIPENNVKLFSYIGNELKYDLCEGLLKDCLPEKLANSVDREKCQQIIYDTRSFHYQLIKLGIFNEDMNSILEYSNNMDAAYINLKCEEYTVDAIAIMKKDLHDLVEVGVHFDADNPLTGDQFPQCSVSRSTIELLDKAQTILQQAVNEPPAMAARIICGMQSIFYQYGSIVCGHHEKLLQTIPQQVVLFRNNCMYLAHQLGLMNETYSPQFPKEVLPIPPIFKDQPHQLRTIGGDIFLGYVESHIKGMERVLADYKFESNQLSENMNDDTDKCLRQCLRQYELLKTVWHKVLPHAVYNKTLGYLVNTFCKKLTNTVIHASDINIKSCELLVEMFKVVLTRAPKLFTDPDEINLYVEGWQKFNDLVFILTSELVTIEDRWKNGALSAHFTPEEVRHLIKALFQNTDRRSYVLSQIVNKF